MSIWIILKLFGSLALLMFGMKSMSESLQKMAGSQLRHVLGAMTTNRFMGVFTGMFVTAAVQSSTATTLMTVSFVNAGLLTLMQAISVIMGAHVGTTVTAWIMSLAFSFEITDLVYPAFFIGIILIYMKRRRIIGDFLFGVAFLFLGLGTLKSTGFALVDDAQAKIIISEFFAQFNEPTFWNSMLFLLMGTVLTLCVQSSAAIMAITMILCSTGVLHIDQGIMLVLGENIGTTITANIMARKGKANTQARRAALAHFTINVIGVTWALILLHPFINAVCSLVGFDRSIAPGEPGYEGNLMKACVVLAAFHTAFNITNTFLQIWFIQYLERFVCWAIKPKDQAEDEDFRLHFITSGIMKTPELSVLEAHKEIEAFAERMQRMFGMVRELLTEKDEKRFNATFKRIEKYENISDNMKPSNSFRLPNEMLMPFNSTTGGASASTRPAAGRFGGRAWTRLSPITFVAHPGTSSACLTQMNILLSGRKMSYDINRTFNIENEINNYRNQLKTQNIIDINKHEYTYAVGTIYMDLIAECEKLGDYVVNVVEARMGMRKKEA